MTSGSVKKGNRMENFESSSKSHIIVRLILWSIRNNGLEKTLDDLRAAAPSEIVTPDNEVWESFIATLKQFDRVVRIGKTVLDADPDFKRKIQEIFEDRKKGEQP